MVGALEGSYKLLKSVVGQDLLQKQLPEQPYVQKSHEELNE